MKTTILYRKLGNEPLASGDGFFNTAGEFQRYCYEYWVGKPNGFIIANDKSPTFRPITVTEPEAPAAPITEKKILIFHGKCAYEAVCDKTLGTVVVKCVTVPLAKLKEAVAFLES